MKTFTNTNTSGFDLVHMLGNKDDYTITESNGTITYTSESLQRTYVVTGNEEINFKRPDILGNLKFKWNDEFTPFDIKLSCKEILDSGQSSGDGLYTIKPDGITEVQAYCDMTTDGGGWTLVIGAGTEFGTTSNFWDGTANSNNNHYYDGEILNTGDAELIMKTVTFTELLMANRTEKPIFQSATNSTFVSKKTNVDSWTGGNTVLNNLSWNRTDRDAYTYANFVLGGRTNQAAAYGDYSYIGIGATVWNASLTTAHSWFNGASLGLVSGTYHHSIADVHHRSASDNDTFGMFIR